MGNTRSVFESEQGDVWWDKSTNEVSVEDTVEETRDSRRKRAKKELDEFKLELARKHEKHRKLIADKHKEMQSLREEVERLRRENEELRGRKLMDLTPIDDIRQKNLELKMTIANLQKDLQDLNADVANFETERLDYKAHVVALKDVVSVSKQMLLIREAQLKELRDKVKEIEETLAAKELTNLSEDLKTEYQRQLQNMRNLRIYYEDRQRADTKEKDEMKSALAELKKELSEEKDKNTELAENLKRLEEENSVKYDEIKNLESNLGLTKAECRQYQAELAVINQLFSQILLGFKNSREIDIDKLIKLLEENHHLLQDIAINDESSQVSALPKVLLDLVSELNDKDSSKDDDEESPKNKDSSDSQIPNQLNSASEIVENLPKVWRVLIELLSHQSAPVTNEEDKNRNPCYKLVETPKGPHLVLSVSQTFIRLKDLILEKKSLERETGRLKHLNTHLECRMQEQEKRLQMVSSELTETWHVVGKLQKKHQLLHTQEKILRYELAQKRKLLTELKEELEYSREKWQEAREKNSNTEKQWEQLRVEFASRKSGGGDDSNNSVESGYSDDKECSSEDERGGYETDASEGNSKRHSDGEEKTVDDVLEDSPKSTHSDGEEKTIDGVHLKPTLSEGEERTIDEVLEGNSKSTHSDGEEKTIDDVHKGDRRPTPSDREERTIDDVLEGNSKSTHSDGEEKTVDDVYKGDPKPTPSDGEERTIDEVLSTREERLTRMENQCSSLVKQVTNTSSRSVAICNKLDALHEVYGEGSGESSGAGDKTSDGE